MRTIVLTQPLEWTEIVEIAHARAMLVLSPAASARIAHARKIVEAIVDRDIRAYGVNTGVGALCDVVVPRARQRDLSHNILMSHAVGVGAPLEVAEVRAIMAAAVNNFAHGYSGLRLSLVERLIDLLNAGYTPVTRGRGSVGYLSHMAQIALTLVGHGSVDVRGHGSRPARHSNVSVSNPPSCWPRKGCRSSMGRRARPGLRPLPLPARNTCWTGPMPSRP